MGPKSVSTFIVALASFPRSTLSSQTFQPNCTIPPPGTNYVSGPNTRSTLAILWNCLSIILLCTWSILHLNVPLIRPRPGGLLQKWHWQLLDASVKIKWMVLTVLMPEYLMGKAFNEWLNVLAVGRNTGAWETWDPIQIYLANMGYFVLDVGDEASDERHDSRPPDSLPNPRSSSSLINMARLRYRYWAVSFSELRVAIIYGVIDRADIPHDQLEKLDRSGVLVKALALIQVIYLVVQLVARKVAGLPSSQLEIATLAFAVSSAVTYILYWDRPQGVETVHIIKANSSQSSTSRVLLRETRDKMADSGPMYLWFGRHSLRAPEHGPVPIPNDDNHRLDRYPGYSLLWMLTGNNDEMAILAFGSVFGGIVFGGLHCLAWNFDFPTPMEKTLWHVCSVMIVTLPAAAIIPLSAWMLLNPRDNSPKEGWARTVVAGLILVGLILPYYIVARLFILFEVFRTLLYLPPEAHIETWSGVFPHWG